LRTKLWFGCFLFFFATETFVVETNEIILHIKNPRPKPALTWGGDYVLCNKNGFIHPNEIIFNALERNEVGASFESYSMLPEQIKINKKIK